jgi:hypothetical protein
VSRETQDAALLDALNAFRALVAALKCADRVAWVDAQISLLGHAGQLSEPEHWNIYEHYLVRDAVPKMIEAVERYNAVAENKGRTQ